MAEVSLVMPVWRPTPEWLHEAVESALLQDDTDLELLVIDDGNPEPITGLLSDVHDPRLRVLRVPHGGTSAARNAGLSAATGDYIRFFDADDIVEAGSTARLRALGSPSTISYEDTVVCDELLQPTRRITSRLQGDVMVPCLLGEFDCRHVSMLFPRKIVERAGPWNTRMRVRQDFDFVLRCVEYAPVVPGTGTATYYRRHASSATHSSNAMRDARASTRLVLDGFFARHPDYRGTATEREAWRRVYQAEAQIDLGLGRPLDAARDAAALLRVAPRDAASVYAELAKAGLRVSGAATARTMARVRNVLARTAR